MYVSVFLFERTIVHFPLELGLLYSFLRIFRISGIVEITKTDGLSDRKIALRLLRQLSLCN